MMDPRTGDVRMLPQADEAAALAELRAAARRESGEVLVVGTEQQLADLSQKVKLGAGEQDRRRARRQQQRDSRKPALPDPPGWDQQSVDEFLAGMEATRRFWLTTGPDGSWKEVDQATFVQAERGAGFFNMQGKPSEPATGSFGSTKVSYSGRVTYGDTVPEPLPC